MGSLAQNGAHGEILVLGRKVRAVVAAFTLDAANAPSITSHTGLRGAGLSAAVRQGSGLYRFTLVDNGAKLMGAFASWMAVQNNVDLYAQPVKLSADTATTFDVQLKTGTVNTDPPATPNGGVLTVFYIWECG